MLHIKLKPGQRIAIGDDITIDVILDSSRKLALRIAAPRNQQIHRIEQDPLADDGSIIENHNI